MIRQPVISALCYKENGAGPKGPAPYQRMHYMTSCIYK